MSRPRECESECMHGDCAWDCIDDMCHGQCDCPMDEHDGDDNATDDPNGFELMREDSWPGASPEGGTP